jgi:hypothetical protein
MLSASSVALPEDAMSRSTAPSGLQRLYLKLTQALGLAVPSSLMEQATVIPP